MSSTFSVLRPFYFDIVDLCRSTGRTKVLIEVKFGQKNRSKVSVEVNRWVEDFDRRSTEKVEDMRFHQNFI